MGSFVAANPLFTAPNRPLSPFPYSPPSLFLLTPSFDQICSQLALNDMQAMSDIFWKEVVPIIQQHRGVVLTMAHTHCLVSWNLTMSSSTHATRALNTATQIQDACQEAPAPRPYLTMGVWSGTVACSSFGSSSLKGFGAIGHGVKQVCCAVLHSQSCVLIGTRKGGRSPPPPSHPLRPLGPDTLTLCGGMVGSPRRERAGIGVRLRCRSFALPSEPHAISRQATRHSMMPGARVIGSRARELSPHVGISAVDGPCPQGIL